MTYGYRAYPYGIRARISHDNGITWGKEITVTADAVSADSGYADTLELEDGRLLTVSYQRRIYSEVNTAIVQVIWHLP